MLASNLGKAKAKKSSGLPETFPVTFSKTFFINHENFYQLPIISFNLSAKYLEILKCEE